jgi:hypothetical protein
MSHSKLLYAVHHVFLPPKLPQKNDQTVENDKFLCNHVCKSIVAYTGKIQGSKWDQILRTVQNLAQTQESSSLSPQTIQDQIYRMHHGGTVDSLSDVKITPAYGPSQTFWRF